MSAPRIKDFNPTDIETLAALWAGTDDRMQRGLIEELVPDLDALFECVKKVQGQPSAGVRMELRQLEYRAEAKRLFLERQKAAFESEDGRAELATAFGIDVIDGDALDEMADPVMLIEGVQSMNSLVRTWGAPKTLKSFIVLHKAACVSLGMPWYGYKTARQKVLYIVAEGCQGMKARRQAWETHHGRKMRVHFYRKPVQIGDPDQMRALIAYCVLHEVGYVIFDTQARCTAGVDENSNPEMGVVISALDVLREKTGACVELVHHSGIDGMRGRGATAMDGAVDTELKTKRKKKDRHVTLSVHLQKDMDEIEDVLLEIKEVGASIVLDQSYEAGGGFLNAPELSDKQIPYLNALTEYGDLGTSATALSKEVGTSQQAASKMLNALLKLKLVERDGKSRFKITDLGEQGLFAAGRKGLPGL